MSSDNKKSSLKGSKVNMKIEACMTVFLASAIGGIIIRFVQMLSYIDPETGFYKGDGNWLHLVFYIILAVSILFFCLRSYLSADAKKITIGNNSNKLAAIGARIFALSLFGDTYYCMYQVLFNMGTTVGYTNMMKSGVLPLTLQGIFAFFSAIYFFVLASDFSKGTAKAYKRKIMATAPVCWAGARLIHRFLRQISFIEVSDLFLELIMIAFMIMFFMALAQVASGVYVDNVKWRLPAFGLSSALIAVVLNVPRLVFAIMNRSLINGDHPFSFADLAFMIFILTLMVKIKEDAKMPLTVSAESGEKAE